MEEKTQTEQVNTPLDKEHVTMLDFIQAERGYTFRTDAMRFCIREAAKKLGYKPTKRTVQAAQS